MILVGVEENKKRFNSVNAMSISAAVHLYLYHDMTIDEIIEEELPSLTSPQAILLGNKIFKGIKIPDKKDGKNVPQRIDSHYDQKLRLVSGKGGANSYSDNGLIILYQLTQTEKYTNLIKFALKHKKEGKKKATLIDYHIHFAIEHDIIKV